MLFLFVYSNLNREMRAIKMIKKEILQLENTISETKNLLNGPTTRLDTIEENICEFEDITVETRQMKHTGIKKADKKMNN